MEIMENDDRTVFYNKIISDNRIKTENEKIQEKRLTNLVLDFYKKVYDENTATVDLSMFNTIFCDYGYIDDCGFYIVEYDTSKRLMVHPYDDDIHSVFIAIVRRILDKKSVEFEQKNRKELKKDFRNRFGNAKYFDTLYHCEYDLDKWTKYFDGNLPIEITDEYNNYINIMSSLTDRDDYYEYDPTTMKFVSSPVEVQKRRR